MKQPKYKNRKVKYAGLVFDSQRELNRWRELLLLERAGAIENLQRQVPFMLVPAQYEVYRRFSSKTGKKLRDGTRCIERAVEYIADFVYWENGKMIVEDAKGVRTDAYVIKRKLMLKEHGIRIREV